MQLFRCQSASLVAGCGCCLILLLSCLSRVAAGSATTGSTKYLTVAVEDAEIYKFLHDLSANAALFRDSFPYSAITGVALNFTYLPIRGSLENVSSALAVQNNLTQLGASAVVSDYYISLAIATYSKGIPYFVIRKNVFSYPPAGTQSIFEIEIDNFHMSQALYDVSFVYKRTTLVVVSDGTPSSSQFLVNFGGRVFSVNTVDNSSTDSSIYNVFTKYNPNSLSSGMGWILLFDEPNLPLMERTLAQASRAGMFVPSQYFFVPSLYDKQNYLTRFYRSDIVIFTFTMNQVRYTRQELLYPFILDCLNHYLKSYSSWAAMKSSGAKPMPTILDVISAESSIEYSLTGPYSYLNHIRTNVQIDVVRSNRSRPVDSIFSLAGTWRSNGAPPYSPDYSGADSVSQSRIVFAAFESQPYFYDYNSTTNTAHGLCLEIVEAMRAQLGFEYKVIRTSSLDEAFQMLKNGSADVSLNFLAPTIARLQFTDPSVDIVQDGIQMLNRKVVHVTNFFHVFHPFSFYVWMSIVLAIILLSATLYICDRISPNTQGKLMFTPFESFFLVLSSFLMSKVETEPKKFSSRLFTLLLWFSTLMYMTTYLSNLVAFLIQPDEQVIFSAVSDLQNVNGYKWGFVKGSQDVAAVQSYWPQVYSRALREWPGEMYINSMEEAVAKVLSDPSFILIASADTLSFVKNQDCKLTVMGSVANSRYLTWLFRRGFRFKSDLDNQLTTRKNTDFAQIRSKYFDLNRCYSGQTDIQNKVPLGFEYLCGLFALLGIGIALGFLQLLGRWVFQRLRERWRTQRQMVHFKLGRLYQAEVYDVKPNGVWIRVHGETEVRFVDNSCLHPNADDHDRHANSHLKGRTIQVQYIGVCSLSGAKIFKRQPGISVSTIENAYSETNSSREESA